MGHVRGGRLINAHAPERIPRSRLKLHSHQIERAAKDEFLFADIFVVVLGRGVGQRRVFPYEGRHRLLPVLVSLMKVTDTALRNRFEPSAEAVPGVIPPKRAEMREYQA